MYLKQVVIYKDSLTENQLKKLKNLLKYDIIKINGKIVIRTKKHVNYKRVRKRICEIMNCKDGDINCTIKQW